MKWTAAVALVFLVFSAPVVACNDAMEQRAKEAGFVGLNCDLRASMADLYDAFMSEDSSYIEHVAGDFMGRLIVIYDGDEDFTAVSVAGSVTVFGYASRAEAYRVGVPITGLRPGDQIPAGTYKAAGFVKAKTVAGFDAPLMVITPYTFTTKSPAPPPPAQ